LLEKVASGAAEPALLDLLHTLLAQFWAALKGMALTIPDEQRHRFETAVIEIAGNIIRYAYAQGNPGPLELALHAYPGYVQAAFTDYGKPFERPDALTLAMPQLTELANGAEEPLAELPEGGFGLALVRMTIDRLEYERTPAGQNRWILISNIEG
jgi:anti-sigma regulatory factor (Ser/Thr protein kinase)